MADADACDKKCHDEWEDKAKNTFSAERKEDLMVLILSTITVVLVLSGLIGTKFYKALFF
jgi:hypothetical protein